MCATAATPLSFGRSVCVYVCVCNRLRIAADCVQQLQHHCLLVEGRVGGFEDAEEDRGEEHAQLALKVRLKDQQQRNEYLHHVSIRQQTSAYVRTREHAEEGGGEAHAQFALKVTRSSRLRSA